MTIDRFPLSNDAEELCEFLGRFHYRLLEYVDVLDIPLADRMVLETDYQALRDAVSAIREAYAVAEMWQRYRDQLMGAATGPFPDKMAGNRPELLQPPHRACIPGIPPLTQRQSVSGLRGRLSMLLERIADHPRFTSEIARDLGMTPTREELALPGESSSPEA